MVDYLLVKRNNHIFVVVYRGIVRPCRVCSLCVAVETQTMQTADCADCAA